MKLPPLDDSSRALDPSCAARFPWVAVYRRADARSLLESAEADLEDSAERCLARVIGQDGTATRYVLAITNRRLVAVSVTAGYGEPPVQRSDDRGMLAVALVFDFFRKRSAGFLHGLERAMCLTDSQLLNRAVRWESSWLNLRSTASAVLLRAKKFPFAPGVSYPVRGLMSIGENVGLRFESDEDFLILSGALDELAPLAATRGVTFSKGDRWHQVDLLV